MDQIEATKDGYEVWVNFDPTAEVFEAFASETGEDYLGCFDTMIEAKAYAKVWIKENREGNK